ncbi:MAG TPA: hypothetical protein VLX92_13135 [Kofleriaceae bacterium]|nr:hypothetical protein [Kofleriaceae bacterium]
MTRGLAIVAALAACRGAAPAHRSGSAAPVEIVNQPALPDAAPAAGTSEEIEPNDTDDVATPLPIGGTVRGKIEPDGDVDRYRIDVPKGGPGELAVTVSGVDQDLILEIADDGGNVIARSARGGVRVAEGVPNLGVTPGRYTAIVRLAPARKKPVKGRSRRPEPAKPAPVYEITAKAVTRARDAEQEPDDDRGTANELLSNDSATGYIGWSGDQDVYVLSTELLSAKNVVAVEVSPVEGVALELEVDDAIGQPLAIRKGARGDGVALHGLAPVIAQGAPPFVYFVVRGDRSNLETSYTIKTTASVPDVDAETEPDDTPEHPFEISPDRATVHATWDFGDVDCFAVPVAAAEHEVELAFATPAELDLAAELFVDGKSVAKVDHPGKGVPEKVGAVIPAGSHAVACVHAVGDAPGHGTVKYDVHVSESGGAGDNAP